MNADDVIVLDLQIQFATDRAVRTNDRRCFLRDAFPASSFVEKRAAGTHIDTRAAEFAVQLFVRLIERRADARLGSAKIDAKYAVVPDILAHAHAAPAHHTQVIVAIKKWILFFNFKTAIRDGVGHRAQADFFDEDLDFALTVIGAILTAGGHAGFANGHLPIRTAIMTIANQAGVWML